MPNVLITGCSSGFGLETAKLFLARGCKVIATMRKPDLGLLPASDRLTILPLDVTDPASIASAMEKAGAIDGLGNNAGFGARGKFWELPLEKQTALMRLQIEALTELTFHLLPGMIERRHGGIIHVSSMTGFQPIPYATTYAATKAFMNSFAMALREELKSCNVAVVTLCPGGTRTNFVNIGARQGRHKFPGGPQPPEEVVEDALKQLQRGGGLVVPRFINKASVFSQRFLPRGVVAKLLAKMSRP